MKRRAQGAIIRIGRAQPSPATAATVPAQIVLRGRIPTGPAIKATGRAQTDPATTATVPGQIVLRGRIPTDPAIKATDHGPTDPATTATVRAQTDPATTATVPGQIVLRGRIPTGPAFKVTVPKDSQGPFDTADVRAKQQILKKSGVQLLRQLMRPLANRKSHSHYYR